MAVRIHTSRIDPGAMAHLLECTDMVGQLDLFSHHIQSTEVTLAVLWHRKFQVPATFGQGLSF